MLTFRKDVIGFLFLLIVFVFGFHKILTFGFITCKNGDYGVWNKIMNGDVESPIVVAGSSRALVHFNCNIIKDKTSLPCYNMAMDGTPIPSQIMGLELLFKYNTPPKYLIQVVDISLGNSKPTIFNPAQYIPYLKEDILYDHLEKIDPMFRSFKYVPLYGYMVYNSENKYAINTLFKKNTYIENYVRYDGYRPTNTEWTGEFDQYKKQLNNQKTRLGISKEAIKNLESIIQLVKNHDTEIILVYPPQYHEYADLVSNKDELMDAYKNIAEKNDCIFWDFTELELCKKKELFYNSQHMNSQGADIFSSIFATQLNDYISE